MLSKNLLTEVIVVGLGAVGSAATWHLARLGTKVLGIDRYKPPQFGSSTGETRLTRVAVGEGVEYSPLALRSNRDLAGDRNHDGPIDLFGCPVMVRQPHWTKRVCMARVVGSSAFSRDRSRC
jgi:FAD dependent oxidoreductase